MTKKVIKHIIILVLLLQTVMAFAQPYGVSTTIQSTSVTVPFLDEYSISRSNPINSTLILTDDTQPLYDVRLKLIISGEGINIETDDNFISNPITLSYLTPKILTGTDLAPYFNPDHLIFQGISKQQYLQQGRLPEGTYSICIEAYDYNRNDPLPTSNRACAVVLMTVHDPPIIISTIGEHNERIPQNYQFSWQPMHFGSFLTEYELSIYESIQGMTPDQIFTNTSPYFRTRTYAVSHNYTLNDPILERDKEYYVLVQAKDVDGLHVFKNDGFSRFERFIITKSCIPNTPCNDGDPCTTDDRYDLNCNCAGGEKGKNLGEEEITIKAPEIIIPSNENVCLANGNLVIGWNPSESNLDQLSYLVEIYQESVNPKETKEYVDFLEKKEKQYQNLMEDHKEAQSTLINQQELDKHLFIIKLGNLEEICLERIEELELLNNKNPSIENESNLNLAIEKCEIEKLNSIDLYTLEQTKKYNDFTQNQVNILKSFEEQNDREIKDFLETKEKEIDQLILDLQNQMESEQILYSESTDFLYTTIDLDKIELPAGGNYSIKVSVDDKCLSKGRSQDNTAGKSSEEITSVKTLAVDQCTATTLSPPVANPALDITNNSFIANWMPYKKASYFILEVSKDVDFSPLYPVASTSISTGQQSVVVASGSIVQGLSKLLSNLDEGVYYYRVKAITNGSHSPYSNVISVAIFGDIPPGCEIGSPCNDGNPCTYDDVIINDQCLCRGTYSGDFDGDGICDELDECPDGPNNEDRDNDGIPDGCDNCLEGLPCDDGNQMTINDVYTWTSSFPPGVPLPVGVEPCECVGQPCPEGGDMDNDGVCDPYDICRSGDDNIDSDNDGVPDACDQCEGFDDSIDVDQDGIPDDCDDDISLCTQPIYDLDSNYIEGGVAELMAELDCGYCIPFMYYQTDYSETPQQHFLSKIKFQIIGDPTIITIDKLTPSMNFPYCKPPYCDGGNLYNLTPFGQFFIDFRSYLAGEGLNVQDFKLDILLDENPCGIDGPALHFSGSPVVLIYAEYNTWPAYDAGLFYDFIVTGCTIPCDDGDPCTINDFYDDDCDCIGGGYVGDDDGDGVCNTLDQCPGQNDFVDEWGYVTQQAPISPVSTLDSKGEVLTTVPISVLVNEPNGIPDCLENFCEEGTTCDDNNPCTDNDMLDESCNCVGTFMDEDNDQVCDAEDQCPGYPDHYDMNANGIPDWCEESDCTMNQESPAESTCALIASLIQCEDVIFIHPRYLTDYYNGGTLIQDIQTEIFDSGNDSGNEFDNAYLIGVEDAFDAPELDPTLLSQDSDGDGVVDLFDFLPGVDDPPITNNYTSDLQAYLALSDSDGNGVPDAFDPAGCDTDYSHLLPFILSRYCDDGNECTLNDQIQCDCECIGFESDSDGDGVCDVLDICQGFDDALDADGDYIPDGCDPIACEYDPAVIDCPTLLADPTYANGLFADITCSNGFEYNYHEEYGDCCCIPLPAFDSDGDGVCDSQDVCPGSNDADDDDDDGVPDGCDGCPQTPGVPSGPCDDNDECTINDHWNDDCECIGIYSDEDYDGVCDTNDMCPGFDDSLDYDNDGLPDGCDQPWYELGCPDVMVVVEQGVFPDPDGGADIIQPAHGIVMKFNVDDVTMDQLMDPIELIAVWGNNYVTESGVRIMGFETVGDHIEVFYELLELDVTAMFDSSLDYMISIGLSPNQTCVVTGRARIEELTNYIDISEISAVPCPYKIGNHQGDLSFYFHNNMNPPNTTVAPCSDSTNFTPQCMGPINISQLPSSFTADLTITMQGEIQIEGDFNIPTTNLNLAALPYGHIGMVSDCPGPPTSIPYTEIEGTVIFDTGQTCTYNGNGNIVVNPNQCYVGMPCDDGDPYTHSDVITVAPMEPPFDCICEGILGHDLDGDGVHDEIDICPFGNDTIDIDPQNGVPDACECPSPIVDTIFVVDQTDVRILIANTEIYSSFIVEYNIYNNDDTLNYSTASPDITLPNLTSDRAYELHIRGICSEVEFTSEPSFGQIVIPFSPDDFECGDVPEFYLENEVPLANLNEDDEFEAGDFNVIVKNATGGNGVFSGDGYIAVPYLDKVQVNVEFRNIFINDEKKLKDGKVKVTGLGVALISDEMAALLDNLVEILDTVDEFLENVQTAIEEIEAIIEQLGQYLPPAVLQELEAAVAALEAAQASEDPDLISAAQTQFDIANQGYKDALAQLITDITNILETALDELQDDLLGTVESQHQSNLDALETTYITKRDAYFTFLDDNSNLYTTTYKAEFDEEVPATDDTEISFDEPFEGDTTSIIRYQGQEFTDLLATNPSLANYVTVSNEFKAAELEFSKAFAIKFYYDNIANNGHVTNLMDLIKHADIDLLDIIGSQKRDGVANELIVPGVKDNILTGLVYLIPRT